MKDSKQMAFDMLKKIEVALGDYCNMDGDLSQIIAALVAENQKRHHAESRADDLAVQRNSWLDGFQDMQRKRNKAEQERDEARKMYNDLFAGISRLYPKHAFDPCEPIKVINTLAKIKNAAKK